MSYSVLAKNPRPERKYPSPIIITTNTPIKGENFKKTTPKEPAIRIKYVKRKLRTMKSIRPGLKKGEFEVVIKIQNKGDVELENIIVQERIPKGFKFSEFTPPKDVKYQINENGKEVELKLMINMLKGKDSINIDYNCTGSGDYPRLEPEITVLGRTDLKSLDKFISEEKMEEIPEYSPDTKFSQQFLGKIDETFSEIYNSINSSPSISNFLSIIDSVKDTFPQGSIRQEFDVIIQKLRDQDNQDKMFVGELQSEVRVKLEYFQKRFF